MNLDGVNLVLRVRRLEVNLGGVDFFLSVRPWARDELEQRGVHSQLASARDELGRRDLHSHPAPARYELEAAWFSLQHALID